MNDQTMNQETMQPPTKKPIYKCWWLWAVAAIIIVLIIAMFGGNDAVQNDLLDYLNNDCDEIIELDSKVRARYEAARASADDYSMYVILRDEVLPESQKLVDIAEDIDIETKEVKDVHELYIESLNKQNQALTLMLSALENQDYSIVAQANEKLDESRKLMRDYESALKKLAKEHDVEFTN